LRRARLAIAALALVAGCTSPAPKPEGAEARLRDLEKDEALAREAARRLATVFGNEATTLTEASRARKEPAAEASAKRLDDAQTALDGLNDAEVAFEMAHTYYEDWSKWKLSAADRARVDGAVARMADAARLLTGHALQLVKASGGSDEAEAARLRKAVWYDRAALKGYRTELGITARLGPEVAERGEAEPAAPPPEKR
jgi:hypothetical protein